MDENRLYSTAYIISTVFGGIKQLIVLSHNFLFLKYFNNLSVKANCLLLEQTSLSVVPEELENFETPYYYMLGSISDFVKGTVSYNDARKYLPNYIRRVLETFMSFKFSLIRNSKGNRKHSPALIGFVDSIEVTEFEESTKSDLKEKVISINSICDAHSHGNAQHTQENYYISANDLMLLAKNAISVIETMDSMHKQNFDARQSD